MVLIIQIIQYLRFFIIQNHIIMRLALSRPGNLFCFSSTGLVTLKFNQQKKSAHITMCNPKKRNTLSLQALRQLKQALAETQKKVGEKKTKIVILQGQGSVFSSGHDLKQLSASKNPKQVFDSCAQVMLKLRFFPVPTLCVVNGIAAAAGFQMTLACDLLIATQKSQFSCPGVKLGLFCSTPAVQLVRSITSEKKANQLLFFGESISAQQAYQYGLVNRVVPQNKLQQTVDQFVTKINNLSSQVITHGKKVLRAQKKQDIQKAYCIAGEGMENNIKYKQDCKEGIKSFIQKRHPHFKN